MTTRRALMLTVLLAGTLSCSEATAPNHVPLYEWRLVVQTDTLSFHWPANFLPVKIWVEDSLNMPSQVQGAIAAWRTHLFYDEYDAVLVSDSSAANVIVRVAVAPPKAVATADRMHTVFPGCEGATDIDTVSTRFELRLPVRMYLTPRYDPFTADLTECFRITAMHELGHSLGIFRHSGDQGDVMYGQPVAPGLSVRDINTAAALSHYPANMTPIR